MALRTFVGFMFFMKNVYTQVSLKGSFPLFVPFTVLQPPPTIHTIPCLLLLSTQPCGLCLVLALFVGAADGAIGVGVGVGVLALTQQEREAYGCIRLWLGGDEEVYLLARLCARPCPRGHPWAL